MAEASLIAGWVEQQLRRGKGTLKTPDGKVYHLTPEGAQGNTVRAFLWGAPIPRGASIPLAFDITVTLAEVK